MGLMMSRWLYLASICLLEAVGLTDLYQFYCALLAQFGTRDSDGFLLDEDDFPDEGDDSQA